MKKEVKAQYETPSLETYATIDIPLMAGSGENLLGDNWPEDLVDLYGEQQ